MPYDVLYMFVDTYVSMLHVATLLCPCALSLITEHYPLNPKPRFSEAGLVFLLLVRHGCMYVA